MEHCKLSVTMEHCIQENWDSAEDQWMNLYIVEAVTLAATAVWPVQHPQGTWVLGRLLPSPPPSHGRLR